MNINFHYGAIKALAHCAGFSEDEAQLVAYASQFTDDATLHSPIRLDRDPRFRGGRRIPELATLRVDDDEFDPICTAHRDIDYASNLYKPRAHRRVYVCFHFIPGQADRPGTTRYRRTKKDAPLARSLVVDALGAVTDAVTGANERARRFALIRLGIALHSFADTWAHEGFSGYHESADNDICDLKIREGDDWKNVDLLSRFVSYAAPDIGHAEAGTLPDRSDVEWRHDRPKGRGKKRDNTKAFLDAAREIYHLLREVGEAPDEWLKVRKRLAVCLREPVKDFARKEARSAWSEAFPGPSYHYDEEEWIDAALERDSGLFDLLGDFFGVDPRDYKVKGDDRFFLFHAAANIQRRIVLAEVPAR